MSFASALDQLHTLGAELAAPDAPRRKFELAHMRALARALGDPQRRFASILIAGTNGKGSTAATLAHIVAAAGLRTGLYTSPHLTRVTERIRTNGNAGSALPEIPEASFARLFFDVDETARKLVLSGELPHPPSYFETLTALAFLYFAEQQVELAVLEVGLGGRLDATNVVEPTLSILTDIALDHQDYLGPTVRDIAREKAGILRRDGTLVTLPQHPEANQAIGEAAAALNVHGINAAEFLPGRNFTPSLREEHATDNAILPPAAGVVPSLARNTYTLRLGDQPLQIASSLFGEHQQRNLALAIAAAAQLRDRFSYNIPNSAIEAGISNTRWPGRLEFLPPNLLLDVAHNPAGAWTLRAALATLPESQPRTLLFSCLRDKDLREIAQILFPLFDSSASPLRGARAGEQHHIVLAPTDNPRAATLEQLQATAAALDIPALSAGSASAALALARELTPPGGLIVVTGSIYLVGAVRQIAFA